MSGTFSLESPTPTRNVTASHFAALASVFDELTPEQRNDMVELCFLLRDLTPHNRKRLLELALQMNGLT